MDIAGLGQAFEVTQSLLRQRAISAGHDISDGGIITALLEMAFAGNCGLAVSQPVTVMPMWTCVATKHAHAAKACCTHLEKRPCRQPIVRNINTVASLLSLCKLPAARQADRRASHTGNTMLARSAANRLHLTVTNRPLEQANEDVDVWSLP